MMPNITPYGYSNNMPLYAAVASPELLTSIYRDDQKFELICGMLLLVMLLTAMI